MLASFINMLGTVLGLVDIIMTRMLLLSLKRARSTMGKKDREITNGNAVDLTQESRQ